MTEPAPDRGAMSDDLVDDLRARLAAAEKDIDRLEKARSHWEGLCLQQDDALKVANEERTRLLMEQGKAMDERDAARAENASLRAALETLQHEMWANAVTPGPGVGADVCQWCGQVERHESDCPARIVDAAVSRALGAKEGP